MEVKGYKGLEVWQAARCLVVKLYAVAAELPESERFGIAAQIRRAAVSLPANIAEGYGRQSPRDYARYLRVAKGSLNELETLLILCEDLGYLDSNPLLFGELAKLGSRLTNLIARVAPSEVREEVSPYGDGGDEGETG